MAKWTLGVKEKKKRGWVTNVHISGCRTVLPVGMQGFGVQGISNTLHIRGGCKHAVGVSDDGDKPGGADDGSAGAADGGDIRGVQLTGFSEHSVGVCDYGDKAGGADDGAA